MDFQDHCLTQFEKEELLEIASLLGIEKNPEIEAHVLVETIRTHLLENGMMSHSLVEDFVKVLRLYDDFITIDLDSFEISPCFGYVNDLDSACSYCLLYLKCGEKLINEKLPECYGQLFSHTSEVCNECMLQDTCRIDLPPFLQDVPESYEVNLFTREPFLSNIMRFLARYRWYRYSMPQIIIKSKFARLQGLKIGNAEVKEVQDRVIKEALYFGGPKGEKATERTPVIFNETRKPVFKEGVYPVRLAWQFGDSKYD